jgi:hypothetical protein
MKKITKKSEILLKFSFLLVFFSIMYSCENEELITATSDDAITNQNSSKASNTSKTAPISARTASGNCSTDCINIDKPYFETTDQQIVTWGGPQGNKFSKTVDIVYYNTATNFVLKVKSSEGWSDLSIDGTDSWPGSPVAANVWGTVTIPLKSGWKACDITSFKLQISGNGPPAIFDVTYNLIGICNDCVTSFTGKAISCGQTREAIYKFKSDKDLSYFKMQGGLTNFTGADAVVTVTGGNNITMTQSTPGGSSNRIIKIEGGISKCSEVTISVTWNSTNTGGVITGSWSVKDANGAEVAPAIIGLECH